jgi:acylphosphatase
VACAHQASLKGVSGFVRNLRDGTVEAVFEGAGTAVEAMVRWCAQGPRGARVTRVTTNEEPPTGAVGFLVTD